MSLPRLLSILVVAILLGPPAGAGGDGASPKDRVVAALQSEGFRIAGVERTWLRRLRIVAYSPAAVREVVMDPRTGEILRDYSESREDDVAGWLEDELARYGKADADE